MRREETTLDERAREERAGRRSREPEPRAVLGLEFIGEDTWAYWHVGKRQGARNNRYERDALRSGHAYQQRPWVARITGRDARCGLVREFIRGQIDYSRANSTGSRGVYLYFVLTRGVYEVYARETWTRSRRYFVRAQGASITELTTEESEAWLRSLPDQAPQPSED